MKLFLTLATLTALASAIVLPTIDEPFPMPTVIKNPQPFPMPTFIDEPAPPKPTFVEEPMACTKICAFSKEVLNCGKNWWPRKSGQCWSCCTKGNGGDEDEDEEDWE